MTSELGKQSSETLKAIINVMGDEGILPACTAIDTLMFADDLEDEDREAFKVAIRGAYSELLMDNVGVHFSDECDMCGERNGHKTGCYDHPDFGKGGEAIALARGEGE